MRLELIHIPVTDVDRARDFYVQQCGWELITDHVQMGDMRIVQIVPPGSGCAILMGENIPEISDMPVGVQKGIHLVVADMGAARDAAGRQRRRARRAAGPRRRALHPLRGPRRQLLAAAAVAGGRHEGAVVRVSTVALGAGRGPRSAQPGVRGAWPIPRAGRSWPGWQGRPRLGRRSSASRST